jgi:hypothetical protein
MRVQKILTARLGFRKYRAGKGSSKNGRQREYRYRRP